MTATPAPETTDHLPEERWQRAPMRPFGVTVLAVVVAIVLVGGLGLAGAAIGRSTKSSTATVTVTGSGTVQGTPNEVQFTVGVQTVAGTAPEALSRNDDRMRALEAKLGREGVKPKDMATSGLDIYPDMNQYGTLTGFTVQDTLDVTMFNVTKAGAAIEAAARAAGNGIVFNGITLSISNDSKYLAAARSRAMHAALLAAQSDARGGGASVGSIVRITDQEQSSVQPVGLPYFNATAAVHGVPIEAGQQPISVQVTVVYALT